MLENVEGDWGHYVLENQVGDGGMMCLKIWKGMGA